MRVSQPALLRRIQRYFLQNGSRFYRSRSAAQRAEFGAWFVEDASGAVTHFAGPSGEQSLDALARKLARAQADAGVPPHKRILRPWEA